MSDVCTHCENRMDEIEVPDERVLFTVFGREIIVRKWHIEYVCMWCKKDRADARQAEIYYQGKSDGYYEAIKEEQQRP